MLGAEHGAKMVQIRGLGIETDILRECLLSLEDEIYTCEELCHRITNELNTK